MEHEKLIELLNQILKLMSQEKASDLYIKAGAQPSLRIEGDLVPVNITPFTPEMVEALALEIMPDYQKGPFQNKPEANFMYSLSEVGRFRVNVYRQRGTLAMVIRKIRDDVEDIETLGLPKVLRDLVMLKRGLILLTGPTGSGKSTTLAAMIDYRNANAPGHIITIEDPIEFLHKDMRSIVSQREVGTDTMSFADALENAVRQAPDVLLIGEMRDVASVQAAVHLAETGHLVLSTLHSNNATQTVERVLQFFPSEIHEQILKQLALNLKAVISQRLVMRKDEKGRVPAIEIMIGNARIQDLLNKGELTQIKRELDVFQPEGMQSFDYSLLELYKNDIITAEVAMRNSDNPNDMRLKIKTLPVYIRSSSREDERYQEGAYLDPREREKQRAEEAGEKTGEK